MILGDLVSRARSLAQTAGIRGSDFLYVLEALLGISKTELLLQSGRHITPENQRLANEAFTRLLNHEPPQHITGKAAFFGLELHVCPDVLIPRPETEGLVELVLQRTSGTARVLDIGTGSGAIAIAIQSQRPSWLVDATDISAAALKIAGQNAAENHAEICYFQCDMFPDGDPSYDVIISNPPYISAEEMTLLDARVNDYEPHLALFGGEDGLDFYRELLSRGAQYLSPAGFMALEHGAEQREAITAIATLHGWKTIEAHQDLQGRDRYLLISSPAIQ